MASPMPSPSWVTRTWEMHTECCEMKSAFAFKLQAEQPYTSLGSWVLSETGLFLELHPVAVDGLVVCGHQASGCTSQQQEAR